MFVSCRLLHKNHRWGNQELWDFDNPVHTCKAFELENKKQKKKQLKVQEGKMYMRKQFSVSKQRIGYKNPVHWVH